MKPKVAFFDFASCEGCQLQVVNLEEKVLDLVDIVQVVSFREAMKEHSDDYDIAFVEGSIMRPMDEERLKKIRSNARILVALGACACLGGVNKLRNKWSVDDVKTEVYGDAQIEGNPYFDRQELLYRAAARSSFSSGRSASWKTLCPRSGFQTRAGSSRHQTFQRTGSHSRPRRTPGSGTGPWPD